jgi:phage gp46-like protein
MLNIPLQLTIDGRPAEPDAIQQRLIRAVVVSLFTWRRAEPDDVLPSDQKFGWWGDNFAESTGDKIGSRLWLLSRAKFTPDIPARAREYAEQALAWLVEDGVALSVIVQSERQGLETLVLSCLIVRGDAAKLNIRFADVWKYINSNSGDSAIPPPVVDFTANILTGVYPLSVSFTDNSLGSVLSWLWSFGDGNISTSRNPVHTYSSPGLYTVILTATGKGGSNVMTKTDYISVGLSVLGIPGGYLLTLSGELLRI